MKNHSGHALSSLPPAMQKQAEEQLITRARSSFFDVAKDILNSYATPDPYAVLPNPKPKCEPSPALGTPATREAQGLVRTLVRITGYRVRPIDPDNFSGGTKNVIDGLRKAGLIPDDDWWRITLQTEQVKVATIKEQKTVIEIETQ